MQRVRTGKRVVVLIAAADRRGQPFGQFHGVVDRTGQNDAGTVQDDGVLGVRKQFGRLGNGFLAACGAFEFDDCRQVNVDHLSPEIARHVDLGRSRGAFRLQDHAVQYFGHARRIADLFLIGDHVLEQFHLLDFLKAALTDGLVGRLRRDQQQRRVVPVGGFHRRHEVGDARAVLRHHHRHLARRAGKAVGHHAAVAFVGDVPELDARLREQVGNRHHCGTDDTERMFDPVHLQNFYKGFFSRHFHFGNP